MRNPRFGNIALDANALNYDGVRNGLVDRLLDLHEKNILKLIVPASVRPEAMDPRTPARLRSIIAEQIYSINFSRTRDELRLLQQLRQLMQGNAQLGKHDADGEHLFEAQKYCTHFVTHDSRIIRKRTEISKLLGNSLVILTVEELLKELDPN